VAQIEGDGFLLRFAQEQASSWGATRFATEFRRRELEERWLEAEGTRVSPYAPAVAADRVTDVLSGPVDAAVQDVVVETERPTIRLLRPIHERHASVPRPPAPETPPDRRRRLRRRRDAAPAPWTIAPTEAARMSPAARRLYGLDDPA
jgi:hypothetical protein